MIVSFQISDFLLRHFVLRRSMHNPANDTSMRTMLAGSGITTNVLFAVAESPAVSVKAWRTEIVPPAGSGLGVNSPEKLEFEKFTVPEVAVSENGSLNIRRWGIPVIEPVYTELPTGALRVALVPRMCDTAITDEPLIGLPAGRETAEIAPVAAEKN